jgi:hypothetical protein
VAVAVANQPGLLEQPCRHGDAGTVDAEHHGQELLRHREVVALGPVMRHQQPAREALVQSVVTVAGCRLGHLLLESQDVAEQEHPQGRALLDGPMERVRPQSQHRARGLNHGLDSAAIAAEQKRQADHALRSDEADLRGPAIGEESQHRGPAGFREVNSRDRLVGR